MFVACVFYGRAKDFRRKAPCIWLGFLMLDGFGLRQ